MALEGLQLGQYRLLRLLEVGEWVRSTWLKMLVSVNRLQLKSVGRKALLILTIIPVRMQYVSFNGKPKLLLNSITRASFLYMAMEKNRSMEGTETATNTNDTGYKHVYS